MATTPKAGVHNNPKTGKTDKISVGPKPRPTLLIEVELSNEPNMESLEQILGDLESEGTVIRAELHNVPPTLKLR